MGSIIGLGANQTIITVIAFILITAILIIAKRYSKNFYDNKNLNITIQSTGKNKMKIDAIVEILKNNCEVVDLIRFDETEGVIESSFLIEIKNFDQLNKAKNELQVHNDNLHITFIDNKGLFR